MSLIKRRFVRMCPLEDAGEGVGRKQHRGRCEFSDVSSFYKDFDGTRIRSTLNQTISSEEIVCCDRIYTCAALCRNEGDDDCTHAAVSLQE